VDIVTSKPVDAVLTDIHMPRMDGYELIEFVRKHYPAVLLFAMTGHYTPETANRLISLGVVWSLEKPFSFDAMASKIADDLRNTPYPQERGRDLRLPLSTD
jgi:DNA-binding NtrC family response regulator